MLFLRKFVVGLVACVVSSSALASQGHDQVPGVGLVIRHEAAPPFVCYGGLVEADVGREYLEGRITRIHYGYTRASLAEFDADPGLLWLDASGAPGVAGVMNVRYLREGGGRGTMILPEIFIPVPPGWNLVYRVSYLKRLRGDCQGSSDALQTVDAESRVFFVNMK